MVSQLSGPDHARALSGLKTLPAYSLMVDLASNESHRELCLSIVTALATNGVAAPGALAWAFEMSSEDPAENFVIRHAASTYGKTSSTIWLARNKAMLAHREKSFNAPGDPILIDDAEEDGREKSFNQIPGCVTIDVDADDEHDGFSVKDVPASPTVSRVTRTSAGAKTKATKVSSPYPVAKPKGRARASDDDVRAAEHSAKGKRPAHEDIIELTSESDADRDNGTSDADEGGDTAVLAPAPLIMSPSIVSPRKKTVKRPAPAKRSPVKTRSTRIGNTDLP